MTLGSTLATAATASLAARIFSGVSLSNVGSNAVVPNCLRAAAIVAMPSGRGSSLNRTSPPPLTWVSMNPGASHAPRGIWRVGIVDDNSLAGTT